MAAFTANFQVIGCYITLAAIKTVSGVAEILLIRLSHSGRQEVLI
jgi:hypothetical protein